MRNVYLRIPHDMTAESFGGHCQVSVHGTPMAEKRFIVDRLSLLEEDRNFYTGLEVGLGVVVQLWMLELVLNLFPRHTDGRC